MIYCYSTVPALLRWLAWLHCGQLHVTYGLTAALGTPNCIILLRRVTNSAPRYSTSGDTFDKLMSTLALLYGYN